MALKKEFQIEICLITEQFVTLPQSTSIEHRLGEDGSISGSSSHMAFFLSFLHDCTLICICGCHSELISQAVISGSVLESMQ